MTLCHCVAPCHLVSVLLVLQGFSVKVVDAISLIPNDRVPLWIYAPRVLLRQLRHICTQQHLHSPMVLFCSLVVWLTQGYPSRLLGDRLGCLVFQFWVHLDNCVPEVLNNKGFSTLFVVQYMLTRQNYSCSGEMAEALPKFPALQSCVGGTLVSSLALESGTPVCPNNSLSSFIGTCLSIAWFRNCWCHVWVPNMFWKCISENQLSCMPFQLLGYGREDRPHQHCGQR